MHESLKVGLLHHVFGLGRVLEQGSDDPIDALVVAPHQKLECRWIVAQSARDQFGLLSGSAKSCSAAQPHRVGFPMCVAERPHQT
jgi:hypothetical protein